MATARTPIPALRCEQCAYDLSAQRVGDADSARCPECGDAIARSEPGARAGVRWQIAPGAGTWFATLRDTLLHPRRTALTLRIEPRSTRRLLVLNMGIGVGLLFLPVLMHGFVRFPPVRMQIGPATFLTVEQPPTLLAMLGGVAVPIFFAGAVAIAAHHWYPRKSPPVRPEVVWANHSLSSYGFMLGAALALVARLAWWLIAPDSPINAQTPGIRILAHAILDLPTLCFFVGLLLATFIDWNALKANRFANVFRDANDAP